MKETYSEDTGDYLPYEDDYEGYPPSTNCLGVDCDRHEAKSMEILDSPTVAQMQCPECRTQNSVRSYGPVTDCKTCGSLFCVICTLENSGQNCPFQPLDLIAVLDSASDKRVLFKQQILLLNLAGKLQLDNQRFALVQFTKNKAEVKIGFDDRPQDFENISARIASLLPNEASPEHAETAAALEAAYNEIMSVGYQKEKRKIIIVILNNGVPSDREYSSRNAIREKLKALGAKVYAVTFIKSLSPALHGRLAGYTGNGGHVFSGDRTRPFHSVLDSQINQKSCRNDQMPQSFPKPIANYSHRSLLQGNKPSSTNSRDLVTFKLGIPSSACADVVIILSLHGQGLDWRKAIVIGMLESFRQKHLVRYALFIHGNTWIQPRTFSDVRSIQRDIRRIRALSPSTDVLPISNTIKKAAEKLRISGRSTTPKLAFLITSSSMGHEKRFEAVKAAQRLSIIGVEVFIISSDTKEMVRSSSLHWYVQGESNRIFGKPNVRKFESLASTTLTNAKCIASLASAIPLFPAPTTISTRWRQSERISPSFKISQETDVSTLTNEPRCTGCQRSNPTDILILFDTTAKHELGLTVQKEFLKILVRSLPLSKCESQISIIQFSTLPTLILPFTITQSEEDVFSKIDNIQMSRSGRPSLAAAVQYGVNVLLSAKRAESTKIAILLSDGNSKDAWSSILNPSQRLQLSASTVVAFYPEESIPEHQLQELIQYTGSSDRVFSTRERIPEVVGTVLVAAQVKQCPGSSAKPILTRVIAPETTIPSPSTKSMKVTTERSHISIIQEPTVEIKNERTIGWTSQTKTDNRQSSSKEVDAGVEELHTVFSFTGDTSEKNEQIETTPSGTATPREREEKTVPSNPPPSRDITKQIAVNDSPQPPASSKGTTTPSYCGNLEVDLMLVIDTTSGTKDIFRKHQEMASEIVRSLLSTNVVNRVALTVVRHNSGVTRVELPFKHFTGKEQVLGRIKNLEFAESSSSLAFAMLLAVQELGRSKREKARPMVIILSDGKADDPWQIIKSVSTTLIETRTTTYAISFSLLINEPELEKYTRSAEKIYLEYRAPEFLPEFERFLSTPTCTTTALPEETIVTSETADISSTLEPFETETAAGSTEYGDLKLDAICSPEQAIELLIAIDISATRKEELVLEKDILHLLVNMFPIEQHNFKVMLLTFSKESTILLDGSESFTKPEIERTLLEIEISDSREQRVTEAIEYSLALLNARQGRSKQIVILVTDGGISEDGFGEDVYSISQALISATEQVFALQLKPSGSEPLANLTGCTCRIFDKLSVPEFYTSVWDSICGNPFPGFDASLISVVPQTRAPPKPRRGRTKSPQRPKRIRTRRPVQKTRVISRTTRKPVVQCKPKFDLMMIFDASGSTEVVFKRQLKLAVDILKALPDSRSYRLAVALIRFSGVATLDLEFSERNSKDRVIQFIQGLEFTGGNSALAFAILLATREIERGRRSDAALMVIIMSDGKSDDPWAQVKKRSKSLKATGAAVFAVSLAKSTAEKELLEYTGSRKRVYIKDAIQEFIVDFQLFLIENVCAAATKLSSFAPEQLATSRTVSSYDEYSDSSDDYEITDPGPDHTSGNTPWSSETSFETGDYPGFATPRTTDLWSQPSSEVLESREIPEYEDLLRSGDNAKRKNGRRKVSGKFCVPKERQNILYLLDTSENNKKAVERQKSILKQMLRIFRGRNKLTRVALITYDSSPKVIFGLKTKFSLRKMLSRVDEISVGQSLQSELARAVIFGTRLLSNQGKNHKSFVIILSDGATNERWDDINEASDRLSRIVTHERTFAFSANSKITTHFPTLMLFTACSCRIFRQKRRLDFLSLLSDSTCQRLIGNAEENKGPSLPRTITAKPTTRASIDIAREIEAFNNFQPPRKISIVTPKNHISTVDATASFTDDPRPQCDVQRPKEVLILLDRSEAMRKSYHRQISLAKRIVRSLKKEEVTFSIFAFAEIPVLVAGPNDLQSETVLLRKLTRLPFIGGPTYIARAIDYAVSMIPAESVVADRFIVILNGGSSDDGWPELDGAVRKLKGTKANIYAVSVLTNPTFPQLLLYTGTSDRIFQGHQIKTFLTSITMSLCKSDKPTEFLPIETCEGAHQMDLAILIDVSENMSTAIQLQKAAATEILDQLHSFSTNGLIQFAIIAFAREPAIVVNPEESVNVADSAALVEDLPPLTGPPKLAKAAAVASMLLRQGRPNARKLTIILSNGEGNENWRSVKTSVAALDSVSHATFALALSDKSNLPRLLLFTGCKCRVFNAVDRAKLYQQLAETFCSGPLNHTKASVSKVESLPIATLPPLELIIEEKQVSEDSPFKIVESKRSTQRPGLLAIRTQHKFVSKISSRTRAATVSTIAATSIASDSSSSVSQEVDEEGRVEDYEIYLTESISQESREKESSVALKELDERDKKEFLRARNRTTVVNDISKEFSSEKFETTDLPIPTEHVDLCRVRKEHDVILILDNSVTSPEIFGHRKLVAIDILQSLPSLGDRVHYSLMSFSNKPKILIPLEKTTKPLDYLDAILGLKTNPGSEADHLRSVHRALNHLTAKQRPGSQSVIVILTDGHGIYNLKRRAHVQNRVKEQKVAIFNVHVSDSADTRRLDDLTGCKCRVFDRNAPDHLIETLTVGMCGEGVKPDSETVDKENRLRSRLHGELDIRRKEVVRSPSNFKIAGPSPVSQGIKLVPANRDPFHLSTTYSPSDKVDSPLSLSLSPQTSPVSDTTLSSIQSTTIDTQTIEAISEKIDAKVKETTMNMVSTLSTSPSGSQVLEGTPESTSLKSINAQTELLTTAAVYLSPIIIGTEENTKETLMTDTSTIASATHTSTKTSTAENFTKTTTPTRTTTTEHRPMTPTSFVPPTPTVEGDSTVTSTGRSDLNSSTNQNPTTEANVINDVNAVSSSVELDYLHEYEYETALPILTTDEVTRKPTCDMKGPTELVLLLDSSSVDPGEFELRKSVAIRLVNSLPIEEDLFRFSLSIFDSHPTVLFDVNSKISANEITRKISQLEMSADSLRMTAKTIYYTAKSWEDAGNGSSSNSTKVLVLISDGESNDNFATVRRSVQMLRNVANSVYAITLSDSPFLPRLLIYTGCSCRIFNSDTLENFLRTLSEEICLENPDIETFISAPSSLTDKWKETTATTALEQVNLEKSDNVVCSHQPGNVIILVDTSHNMRDYLDLQKEALFDILKLISPTSKSHLRLKVFTFHSSVSELLMGKETRETINNITHSRTKPRLADAINVSIDGIHSFPGEQNYVFLLTDGTSKDAWNKTYRVVRRVQEFAFEHVYALSLTDRGYLPQLLLYTGCSCRVFTKSRKAEFLIELRRTLCQAGGTETPKATSEENLNHTSIGKIKNERLPVTKNKISISNQAQLQLAQTNSGNLTGTKISCNEYDYPVDVLLAVDVSKYSRPYFDDYLDFKDHLLRILPLARGVRFAFATFASVPESIYRFVDPQSRSQMQTDFVRRLKVRFREERQISEALEYIAGTILAVDSTEEGRKRIVVLLLDGPIVENSQKFDESIRLLAQRSSYTFLVSLAEFKHRVSKEERQTVNKLTGCSCRVFSKKTENNFFRQIQKVMKRSRICKHGL